MCSSLILAACSHEQTAFKNPDDVVEELSIQAERKDRDQPASDATSILVSADSELKAYFIHAKIVSRNQKYDVKDADNGVVYFHETKESDPRQSFLKNWDNNPDFIVDYDKMTAISKSTHLVFYIQDQIDPIPVEQTWMYREED